MGRGSDLCDMVLISSRDTPYGVMSVYDRYMKLVALKTPHDLLIICPPV